MKAVDELEAERDQQRDPQQHEGADRHRRRVGRINVAEQTVQRVAEADGKQHNENHRATDMRPGVEIGPGRERGGDGLGHDGPLDLNLSEPQS